MAGTFTLPNLLTILRLSSTPFLAYLILKDAFHYALLVFFFAGLTDLLDGWIARRFHMYSRLGSYLDPLADKALMLTLFVVLGYKDLMPASLICFMIARDILILLGAFVLQKRSQKLQITPLFIGKVHTTLQMLAVAYTLAWPHIFATIDLIVWGVLGITTMLSMLGYVRLFIAQLRK